MKQRKKQYASAKDRFIKPALMNFLKTEFPSLGGDKIRKLFIEELMKILDKCYYPSNKLRLGQMRWLTLSKETRATNKDPQFVPVTLTLVSEGDIGRYCNGINREEIMQDIIARLLTEAYEQGGLLSMRDLSLIMCYGDSYLSNMRLKYERRNNTTLHFTGYDHDMGTAISHKATILRKIFVEKKDPVRVARETGHSPEAVQNYCIGLNKVKWCMENKISKDEIRLVTGMSAHLIDEYIKIMEEDKDAAS
ncbi:MAG: DUF1670 domain-containing protein [Candidatus Altiarchaeales archaeon]|nr:DUF1670 domain-containing protein [Candidatus Altiarchaeales archaeon]